jgi:hypothetical protein
MNVLARASTNLMDWTGLRLSFKRDTIPLGIPRTILYGKEISWRAEKLSVSQE